MSNLVPQIKAEYAKVLKAEGTALEHAIRCGELLIQAKGNMKHGEWAEWLGANIPEIAAVRTATQYIRLARNQDQIKLKAAEIGRTSADLSINQADKLLRKPKESKPEQSETDEQSTVPPPLIELPPSSFDAQFDAHLKNLGADELLTKLIEAWDPDFLDKLALKLSDHLNRLAEAA
jgi:hypothetical protein